MRRSIPLALILLLACHSERVEAPSAATSARVLRADGAELLAIRESSGSIEIALADRKLRGDTRDSGKRKYSVDGGAVSYEIKPGDDDGFKLRTADGTLRWKVKISPEKIKISDNEENANPFELKFRDGDRVKVVAPGDREIGNVRLASSRIEVENASGETLYRIDGTNVRGAYGVLLLDSIPEVERHILLAEILSRGR